VRIHPARKARRSMIPRHDAISRMTMPPVLRRCVRCGGPGAWIVPVLNGGHICSACFKDEHLDDLLDDAPPCNRCGGDGLIEYGEAPEAWGGDTPDLENHFVPCPECRRAALASPGPASREAAAIEAMEREGGEV
jgi:hypothetical protein